MTIRFSIDSAMISGQGEAVSRTYKLIKEKDGYVHLVADQPNEADNIYCGYRADQGHPHSEGMGGATLEFKLNGGGSVKIQGPWHSNADSLFRATGYDCRDKYLTQGIVAKKRTLVKGSWGAYDYDDVVHYDEEAQLGEFSRIEKTAQGYTDRTGEVVFYAFRSRGGGATGSTRLVKTPISGLNAY